MRIQRLELDMQAVLSLSVIALVICCSAASAVADQDVDHIALAERLYADGHMTRAKQALSRMDPESEDTDLKALNMIAGLIDLNQKSYASATKRLNIAIQLGEKRSLVYLGLAQSYYYQQQFAQALTAVSA